MRDLEQIQDLDKLELLYHRLPSTVGSVLSINHLREDLEVAFNTAKNWISVLERLYGVFRILPFGAPKIKAIKKEPKLYMWDWSRVEEEAQRFENLVAVHLMRLVHWCEDVEGIPCELRFFRSPVGHEVDFVLLKKGEPWMAIEVKLNDQPLDANLKYLLERVKFPYAFQLSYQGQKDWTPPGLSLYSHLRVMPAVRFLANLP